MRNICVVDLGTICPEARAIGAGRQPGTPVFSETTLPVGATRRRHGQLSQGITGLGPCSDVHLVFSPELVLTGRVFADPRKHLGLLGGRNAGSEDTWEAFHWSVHEFDDRQDLRHPVRFAEYGRRPPATPHKAAVASDAMRTALGSSTSPERARTGSTLAQDPVSADSAAQLTAFAGLDVARRGH